MGASERAII